MIKFSNNYVGLARWTKEKRYTLATKPGDMVHDLFGLMVEGKVTPQSIL